MITITNLDNGQSITIAPSSFKWSRNRVSAADSGRDQGGTMYVNQVTQKVKLELTFNGLDWAKGSELLQCCDSEYITCTYPDMLTATYQTRTFYTGDREGEVFIWWDEDYNKILSSLTFNFIER